MTATRFDVVVIGAGPGGYVAAIRAAQLGLSVACIDRRDTLGGTCLNVGCIPSKALLHSSELYEEASHDFAQHGIKVEGVALDLRKMMARKDKVVGELTKGIAFLLRKNKVTFIQGSARITGAGAVEVTAPDGKGTPLACGSVVIATGSESTPLPGIEVDEQRIVTSTGALALAAVPAHLVVIGAGYIGLELGTAWRRLGAKVTVVEFLDRILPTMDGEVAREFQKILVRQGIVFRLGTKVTAAKARKGSVDLTLEAAAGGAAEALTCDAVLVAVGRRPFTDGLGLEELGITRDNRGRVTVNGRFETSVPGIYAIGDVIAGPMLAHKASDEGVIVAEVIAGQSGHIDYDLVPGVVYTAPEVASVGRTEEQLKADGVPYRVGRFPFAANARAKATGNTDGFVKVLAHAESNRVLGVHIIGPDAGTLIAEAALVMEFGGAAEDIARTSHAHPSLNEAVREAALAVGPGAIHI
ncbi:MAG: dihydrolipoyl dehydrogenase [Alphaproteobacteria bacterium]|nr:dihydrolipoyl dehydrogenase [Alphaproteobacteria bacterium]